MYMLLSLASCSDGVDVVRMDATNKDMLMIFEYSYEKNCTPCAKFAISEGDVRLLQYDQSYKFHRQWIFS